MDHELLIALCIFWLSITLALVTFLPMWFLNEGEAFHPHSVALDKRHSMYMVVSSETQCKHDFCVASISSFVAPRGSTSSKYFSLLCTSASISGFLGSYRWFKMGDAKQDETLLALWGFFSLLLVASFELDVSPHVFLQIKLQITKWLMEKQIRYNRKQYTLCRGKQGTSDLYLAPPFPLTPTNLLLFIRESPLLYSLYEEDAENMISPGKYALPEHGQWDQLHGHIHMIGAIGFVCCVTTSVILNDANETSVAIITGISFFMFSFLGYLTGSYVWLIPMWRGIVMQWNPFMKEPHFMAKLQRSVAQWVRKQHIDDQPLLTQSVDTRFPVSPTTSMEAVMSTTDVMMDSSTRKDNDTTYDAAPATPQRGRSPTVQSGHNPDTTTEISTLRQRTRNRSKASTNRSRSGMSQSKTKAISEKLIGQNTQLLPVFSSPTIIPNLLTNSDISLVEAENADKALDNTALRYARSDPKKYLLLIGHLLVMSELVALLTPCVAVGIQWITALCNSGAPPLLDMIELLEKALICAWMTVWDPTRAAACDLTLHCIVRGT